MPQKFAFTTAAMAAALEETPVSYEDLADIERDFDDAETDISEFRPSPRQHNLFPPTTTSPQCKCLFMDDS
jgi:hypothetical protein